MSSLRNAVQRRNHKERAQPLERSKWGLLEKHKDYSLRAKDHNSKKARLKTLRQKAAERNPDEFAFGMMSSKTENGVRVTKRQSGSGGHVALSDEAIRLLKTQDAGYLGTVLQQTKRERQKVMERAALLEAGVAGPGEQDAKPLDVRRRKRFDEDGNEITLSPAVKGEEDAEGQIGNGPPDWEVVGAKRRRRREVQSLRRRIDALHEKERQLGQALEAVETQRAKMAGTLGGVNKAGVKFKPRERKR